MNLVLPFTDVGEISFWSCDYTFKQVKEISRISRRSILTKAYGDMGIYYAWCLMNLTTNRRVTIKYNKKYTL